MELGEVTMHETKTVEDRRKEYESLGMSALVDRYNSMNPKTPATTKTFSSKAKAISRILAREDELDAEQAHEYDEAYRAQDEAIAHEMEGPPMSHLDYSDDRSPYADPEPEPEPQQAQPEPTAPQQAEPEQPKVIPVVRAVSIKQMSMDLLSEVAGVTEDGKKVGHPYDVILQKIKAAFPGCKTSIACLRWYSVHMRQDEHVLPQRPRKESVRG